MVFRGGSTSGSSIISAITSGPTAAGGPGGVSENGVPGLFRLLNAQLGGQVSWLLALGVDRPAGDGLGHPPERAVARRADVRSWFHSAEARRNAHLTPQQSALALWGGWTLTMAIFFSVAGFYPHLLSLDARARHRRAGRHRASCSGVTIARRAGMVVCCRSRCVVTALVQASSWPTTPLEPLDDAADRRWLAADRRAAGLVAFHAPPATPRCCPPPVDRCLLSIRRAMHSRTGCRSSAVAVVATALGVALLLLGPATWVGVSLASGAGGTLPTAGPSASLAQGGGFGGNGGPRGLGGGRSPPTASSPVARAMAASAASHQPSAGRATDNLGRATAAVARPLAASPMATAARACR